MSESTVFERFVKRYFKKRYGKKQEVVNTMTNTNGDVLSLTDYKVQFYKKAFLDYILATEDDNLPWDERREGANKYAASRVPQVAEALSEEMSTRSPTATSKGNLDSDGRKIAAQILGWKVQVKKKYDPAEVPSDSKEECRSGRLIRPKGYLIDTYRLWAMSNDHLACEDSVLAFWLGASPSSFSSHVRPTLIQEGFEFEKAEKGYVVVARPMTEEEKARIAAEEAEKAAAKAQEKREKIYEIESQLRALLDSAKELNNQLTALRQE